MARQVKRFGEHSQRWQQEARRQGISARKWNRWRGLSSKARADSNPTDYAKGKTLPAFRSEKKQTLVFDSLDAIHRGKPKYRPRGLRASIAKMTAEQMRKVLSFKTTAALAAFIEAQLRSVQRGSDSVWYYQ